MSTRNQRFYDSFMLILGLFVGVLVGIIFMKAFSAGTGAEQLGDAAFRDATNERIQPIGRVALIGDPRAWTPRVAQGQELLRERVIYGYQGEQGIMAPKGGRPDLSDEEIFEALDFMLRQAQP